ncbi:MAG: hypothetical protein A2854_00860 [Parcubacteria group bacterium RIFCSPHIGHO2_01_FULL_56_18]|nr:MAG: hypothetical protein A2854_00860 [Parcubacteria group bacterium RIFCSPHIGHO2_01_FULL_56_18]
MISATTASTTNLTVSALGAAACDVKSTNGVLSCGTDTGGSFPFTPGTYGATQTQSTTTALQLFNGLYASTTIQFGSAGLSQFFFNSTVGNLGLGTTSPFAALQIATTTGKNLVLSDSGAGANLKHWLFSSMNGNLYIGTTTDVFATSSPSAFTITNSGNVGIGTSTPGSLFGIQGIANFTTGTSTIYNNLNVQGQLKVGTGSIFLNGAGTSTFSSGLNIASGCFAVNGTCVGTGSGVSGGAANKVAFFTDATTLSNNTLFHFDNANTLLGIGTTTPWAKLSIHANNGETNETLFAIASSTASATTTLFSVDNTGLTTIGGSSGTGDANFQFAGDINAWSVGYKSSDKSFNIASSTNLTDTAALSIAKNGNTTIVGSAVTCTIGNGSSATNCSSSDARLKTDIAPLQTQDGLAAIMTLNPVSFNWNAWMQSNGSASTTQFGFIAQDVQNVFPTLVTQDVNSGYYKLDYQGFAGPTIKAIQELNLKLEGIASTTATSTPQSQSFASSFFSSLFSRITTWLADATNGIVKIVTHVLAADRVETKQLCVDDICVTKDQFAAVFGAATNDNPPASVISPPTEISGAPATTTPADAVDLIASSSPGESATSSPPANDNEPPAVQSSQPAPDVTTPSASNDNEASSTPQPASSTKP